MTPAARLQATIEILDAWRPGRQMDRLLLNWARANRYAGSGDRAAVADHVYDALRRWRSLGWPETGGDGRARVLAMAEEAGAAALFSGERHAPAPLTEDERRRLAERRLEDAPEGVRADMPDWLVPRFHAAHAERAGAVMAALRERAPVDLRANRLKGDVEAARRALAADGIEAVPVVPGAGEAPMALRVEAGARALRRSAAYLEGLVEIQDVASQAAAAFAQARPGERVLDFCAGGGGKTLALGADMGGEGEILAHDVDPGRMADLPARAARAGLRVKTAAPLRSREEGFELVFVDAPCSGSGAWRRNPDAKWGFRAEDLERLAAAQADALREAARFVAPGGRLVYATCSLLEEENGAAVAAFLPGSGFEAEAELRLTPLEGGDGFYAARLRRRGG